MAGSCANGTSTSSGSGGGYGFIVPNWLVLVLGVVMLWLVWSERHAIASSWRRPARWWRRDADEYIRSRSPSQPLNVVLGVTLGLAAIVYGIVALLA